MLGRDEVRARILDTRTPVSENKRPYGKEQDYQFKDIYLSFLKHVPTNIEEYYTSRKSGRPVVSSDSSNIFSNIIQFVKPSPTPSFSMAVMYKLIEEGVIKRVAGLVRKVDYHTEKAKLERVYLYVQSNAELPEWWVVPLNAKSSLRTMSYINPLRPTRSSRIISDSGRLNFNSIFDMLPDTPTTAEQVNQNETPGTSRWITSQLGMELTYKNIKKVTSLMLFHVRKGDINKILKPSSIPTQGIGMINIYFKS